MLFVCYVAICSFVRVAMGTPCYMFLSGDMATASMRSFNSMVAAWRQNDEVELSNYRDALEESIIAAERAATPRAVHAEYKVDRRDGGDVRVGRRWRKYCCGSVGGKMLTSVAVARQNESVLCVCMACISTALSGCHGYLCNVRRRHRPSLIGPGPIRRSSRGPMSSTGSYTECVLIGAPGSAKQ